MKFVSLSNSDRLAIIDNEDAAAVHAQRWFLTPQGYAMNHYGEPLHRFVMGAVMNDGTTVDHRYRHPLDCRKAYLRFSTTQQNRWNRGPSKANKSGYVGIHQTESGGWHMSFTHPDGHLIAATYWSLKDAVVPRNELALKFHGEFAYLNEVPE